MKVSGGLLSNSMSRCRALGSTLSLLRFIIRSTASVTTIRLMIPIGIMNAPPRAIKDNKSIPLGSGTLEDVSSSSSSRLLICSESTISGAVAASVFADVSCAMDRVASARGRTQNRAIENEMPIKDILW